MVVEMLEWRGFWPYLEYIYRMVLAMDVVPCSLTDYNDPEDQTMSLFQSSFHVSQFLKFSIIASKA